MVSILNKKIAEIYSTRCRDAKPVRSKESFIHPEGRWNILLRCYAGNSGFWTTSFLPIADISDHLMKREGLLETKFRTKEEAQELCDLIIELAEEWACRERKIDYNNKRFNR